MRKRSLRLIEGDPRVVQTPPYLDVRKVAEVLQVSRATIYAWLHSGRLRAVKHRGQVKVASRSLRALLRRHASGGLKLHVNAKLGPVKITKTSPLGGRRWPVSEGALWGIDEHGELWLIA